MNKSTQPALQKLLSDLRSKGEITIRKVVQEASSRNLSVTLADLQVLSREVAREDVPLILPPWIAGFVAEYMKDAKIESILDPVAGVGSLIIPLAERRKATIVLGLSEHSDEIEIASKLATEAIIQWEVADLINGPEIKQTFDVIIGAPPLGMKPDKIVLPTEQGDVSVNDAYGYLLLLKSCFSLAKMDRPFL